MKTPREILLKRHEGATPKLDLLRQEVLVSSFKTPLTGNIPATRSYSIATLPRKLWRELILPCRRLWIGMGVAWVMIIGVNVTSRLDEPISTMAKSAVPPSPEVMAALKEQRLLLTQLIGPVASSPADRPKNSPPRSELKADFQIV